MNRFRFCRLLHVVPAALLTAWLWAATTLSATQIIYVRADASAGGDGSSWANAYDNLQSALAVADGTNPVEIWVKVGVYKPTTGATRTTAFELKTNVALRGGFLGTEISAADRVNLSSHTVLSGDIGAPDPAGILASTPLDQTTVAVVDQNATSVGDNSYNVLRAVNVGNVTLDRLVVTGGCANDSSIQPAFLDSMTQPSTAATGYVQDLNPNGTGGGLFALNSGVSIVDCTFARNVATGIGGGIVARGASIAINTSTFVRNSSVRGGGAVALQDVGSSVGSNTFYGNSSGHLGGAMLVETSTGSADARAFLGQLLVSLAADTYAARQLPRNPAKLDPSDPLTYLPLAKDVGSIASTVVRKLTASTTTLTATGVTATSQATKLFGAEIGNAVSSFATVYTGVAIGFAVFDIGVQIAELLGVSPNDPFVKTWSKIDSIFNSYCSPVGLLITIAEAILGATPVDHVQRATDLTLAEFADRQNTAAYQTFSFNSFELNSASGVGGAIAILRTNVNLENCWFVHNDADVGGGAVASFSYNKVNVESSAFVGNQSYLGHSAFCAASRSVVRSLNNAFVQNQADAAKGRAFSIETGADAFIGNCVFWGNTSGAAKATGADVFAARYADLDATSQKGYADAGDSHGIYVGTCNIRSSDIQSLNTLTLGTAVFANPTFYNSPNGFDIADGNPNVGEGIQPTVTSGSGNFSRDPILLNSIYPHPLSPLVNAGSEQITLVNDFNDLAGNERRFGTIDIGPIESDGTFAPNTILYVNGALPTNGDGLSWATAFNNLASAVAAPLSPGGQIWVAYGSYYPTAGTDRSVTLNLRPGVMLIGGFKSGDTNVSQSSPTAQATIISGDIGSSSTADNSYTLLTGTTQASDQDLRSIPRVLQGLYFTDANGGPAVKCASPLVVRNCVFHHNGAANRALVVTPGDSDNDQNVQIVDSTFLDNAGGAVDSTVFNFDVIRSNFYGNTAPVGAALYLHGPANSRHGTTLIERSAFADNVSTNGRGGAIYFEGLSLRLVQSVVVDNTATPDSSDTSNLGGAGLWQPVEVDPNDRGQVAVTNSIFYGNRLTAGATAATIERQQLGLPIYEAYLHAPAAQLVGNDIEGLRDLATPGGAGGNVDYDPFFVDAADDDFRLADDSMLLNRGTSYTSGTDTTALTGANDIGVFENSSTTVVRPTVALTFTAFQPTDAGRTFTFTLPSGTTNRSGFFWEVRRPGGGYVTVTADAYTSGVDTATLTLTNPPYTWSGSLYRLVFLDADGKRSFTDSVALVCAPSFLYVAPNGAGTKDGTSWANAFASPGDALAIATAYTQIFVAGGDYTMAPAAMQPGARLYGGFAGTETSFSQRATGVNETILRCSPGGTLLNVAGVATYPTLPTPTVVPNVIDGFTVKAAPGAPSGGFGFGSANVTVSNVKFNFAGIAGSAISAATSTLNVSNCTFTDGTAAMIAVSSSTVTVSGSTFTGNGLSRSGQAAGGIAAEGSCALSVTDSTFSNNFGYHAGAIDQQTNGRYSPAAGTLLIERCRFLDDAGGNSGAVFVDTAGSARIANSLFARNQSVSNGGPGGGAIAMDRNARVAVVQCTIVANAAQIYGAAVDATYGGFYSVTNSVVWSNVGTQTFTGNHSVTNSIIQGNSYDPLIDPTSADYALGLGSPLIDQAGNDSTLSGGTDLAGRPRIFNGAADLGASEYPASSPHPVYVRTTPTDQSVFVERAASFTIDASVDANTGSTPIVWQYFDGTNWQSVSGLTGWSVSVVNGVSTLTNPGVALTDTGRKFRATIPAAPGVALPVTLTVKPRIVLYVDSRVATSGDGYSWAQAYQTIGAALAVATADTDVWVATGDYTENNLTPPFGARVYLGFAGTETDVSLRDPVANPVRIGSPLADRTLVVADVTTLVPPITLSAGQTAQWQVDTGDGNFVALAADANRSLSLVNGVPGLSVTADSSQNGYRYRVVVSDANGVVFTSLPAQITVIARPTVYVDAAVSGGSGTGADWADAFSDLGAALAAYPAFADFKVAEGTYIAPANGSFLLRRSLTLTGGYVAGTETRDPVAHRTILQSPGSATSFAITMATAADRGAVDSLSIVDGFVFQNAGAGLGIRAASPIIRNCRFENLVQAATVADGNPAFSDCTFTDQLDSAVSIKGTAQVTFDHADFERNGAGIPGRTAVAGGAITAGDSSGNSSPNVNVTIADSTFTGNFTQYGQAAVFVAPGATLAVNRTQFTGNAGGISSLSASTVTVRESLFAHNTGGPVLATSGSLTLVYSTVANNDSYNTAVTANGPTVVSDCIIWGNTQLGSGGNESYQISNYAGQLALSHTIVEGLRTLGGTQLLPFSPRFVDAANGDFRLAADSPAIDAGLASDLLASETDLDGANRPVGGAPDLGAFEATSAGTPDYGFGLPASLAGPVGSTLTLSYVAPVGSSVVWQYSTDGSTWSAINPTSGTGTNPPGVTTTTVQSLSLLTLAGIQQALDGVSLRMVVTVSGVSYTSAAIPITIQAFQTLYVDASVATSGDGQSWATAYKTLTEALAAADAIHRNIWIAEGTYRPATTAPDSGTFHLIGFNVLGGFPAGGGTLGQRDPAAHPTIFTGLPANGADPRSPIVVRLTAGGLFEATLDGVTVENGATGILVEFMPPHLANLVVRGHTATGLAIVGGYNTAGGNVTNCVIENNSATNGGGVSLTGRGSPVFERDIIRGNTASGNGGGIYSESPDTVTFTSVLISGNVADTGGGAYGTNGTCNFDQTTIAGNRSRLGAAIYSTRYVRLRDSIVWGNRATAGGSNPQLDTNYAVQYVFANTSRTDVEQTTLSSGVVRYDPVFVSPVDASAAPSVDGDYRLRAVSPAIDAGDNTVVTGYTLDLASQARVTGAVDLGAYESAAAATPLAVASQPSDLTFRRASGSNNTFTVVGTGAVSVSWQYAAPGGSFSSLVGVNGFSGADTATLTVAALDPALNGYRFRAALTADDGSVVYSDEKILTVYSPRYYVNAARAGADAGDGLSWATAFRSLDAVLALPYDSEGTEIWVAAGTYTPATSFVLRPGVSLYGGFTGNESAVTARDPAANVTSLVGAAGSAPVVSIPFVPLATAAIVVDGFTIRDTVGYGIAYLANFALNVNQVRFSGLGTAINQFGGNVTVTGSSFTGNRVAIYSKSGALTLERDEFRGNGVTGGDPVVTITSGNSQLVDNTLFAGNVTTSIYTRGSTILRQTTIANNLGGAAVDAGAVTIQNSIIWGNRTAGSTTVPAQVSGSLLAPVANAIELVTSKVPVFVGPAAAASAPTTAGNYELDGTSTVIETGDNTESNPNGVDLAGLARLHGAHVDPGAYEYQSDPYWITSPSNAVGTPVAAARYTVSASAPVTAYAWDESTDNGTNWIPLTESSTYAGVATATLAITGDATFAGHLYRARVQFTDGPEIASGSARFDYVSIVSGTTAGFATPAVFTSSATGSVTSYVWQVSIGGGAYTTVTDDANHSGANTSVLTVTANSSFANRTYRLLVTFSDSPTTASNTTALSYADIAASPLGVMRNGILGYGSTTFGFSVTGGIDPATLTDAAIAVHTEFGGRFDLADLGTPTISGNDVTLAFTSSLHAGERVAVSTTSALHRADGISARPQIWEFHNGVRSGSGIFDAAQPLSGATSGATAFALGDLDGDAASTIDALVATATGNQVYLNNGHGGFSPAGAPFGVPGAVAIVLGNLANGGALDAVIANADGSIQIWSNNGAGTFTLLQTIAGESARALALGDFDGDGSLDLFVVRSSGNRVYLNDGSGTFAAAGSVFGSQAGTAVALGDVNGDGLLDALVGAGSSSALWLNQGRGGFMASPQSFADRAADRVAIADFNQDGLPDLAFARANAPTQVLLNQGDGVFTASPSSLGGGIATLASGDVDGDGRPDLALTDATGGLRIWSAQANGSFVRMENQPALAYGSSVELADLDGDGALDVFGLDASGTPAMSLYRVVASVGPEESDLTLTSTGFTRDGGGAVAYVRIASLPAAGMLLTAARTPVNVGDTFALSDAASLIYRPNPHQFGFDSFAWSGSADGTTFSPAPISYWVIIAPIIHDVAPAADALVVAQGGTTTTLTGGATSVLANDVNLDPATALVASVVQPPAHGMLTLDADGTFQYRHDGSETRSDQFVYLARNTTTNRSAEATVTITITNVNDAPATLTFTPATVLYTGQPAGTAAGVLSATDPDPEDAGLLTFSLVPGTGDTDNAEFIVAGTTLETAAPLDFSTGLTRSVRLRATDPGGLSFERAITISLTRAPEAVPASFTGDEDGQIALSLSGLGGASTLSYQIATPPANGALTGTGSSLVYHPGLYYRGSDSFTYTVSDGTITSAPVTVSLTVNPVNHAPTLSDAALPDTTDKASVSLTLAGADVDGDALQYWVEQQGQYGTATINGSTLTYTPTPDVLGADAFDFVTVYAYDPSAARSASAVVQVKITPVDDPPVLADPPVSRFDILKGATASFVATVTDPDSTFTSVVLETQPTHGFVVLGAGHSVVYTPNAGFAGDDSFTLHASDGQLDSNTITVNVRVLDPAPTASAGTATGDQRTVLHTFLNGFDPQGDLLTATIVTGPAHGTVTMSRYGNAGYDLYYSPDASFFGTDSLTFTMTDPGGNVSDPATVTFTVNQVNLAPVAQAVTRSQDGLLPTMALTLAGTDAEGAALTYRIVTSPTHGTLTGSGPAFTYTLTTAPYEGTDSFTYVVNDGVQDSAPATVSLTFVNNHPNPVVAPDTATVYRGLWSSIDVLANDSDPWGNPLFIVSVTQGAHGSVTHAGTGSAARITYQHNGDDATEDQFTYTVSNFDVLVTQTVFVTISDHVLTVTSTADSGPGSLRDALNTVNQLASVAMAPNYDTRPTWTIQLDPYQAPGSPDVDFTKTLATVGESDASIGDSALVVTGTVTIQGFNASLPIVLQRPTYAPAMRLLHIAPGATVTLKDLSIAGGIAHQGGGIYNEGTLTLDHVTLDGNTAQSLDNDPGVGGGLVNHNASVTLDTATFTDNVADDAGGLYSVAEGFPKFAHVIAHDATFSGHGAAADFRSVSVNGGQADMVVGTLSAETPTAPWFDAIPDTTINRRFSATVPVRLNSGQAISFVPDYTTSGRRTVTVTGRGDARSIVATFDSGVADGVHPVTITASGGGVSFQRTMNLTLDSASNQAPIARDDHIVVAPGEQNVALTALALLNDEDPDGTPINNILIQSNPSIGTITEIAGQPYYNAPVGATGTTSLTYIDDVGSNVATIYITFQARSTAVSATADTGAGSLRAAIDLSNTYSAQAWTVLPSGLATAQIDLSTVGETDPDFGVSALAITGNVTIDGSGQPGLVIARADGAPAMRLFHVLPGATLTLRNLTLENGLSPLGGAIFNEGTVILDGVTLQNNTAPATDGTVAGEGGAIYNEGGVLTIGNSTLTANTAASASDTIRGLGGAIFTHNGAVAINGTAVFSNTAGDAGALYAEGDAATATASFTDSRLGSSDASADVQGSAINGGHVVFNRRNSSIDRISGPWISPLGTYVIGATDQLTFFASDSMPDLMLSATSSNQGIVPNSGLTIANTDSGHGLSVVADHAGIADIDVIAASDGVEFHETFTAYATSGAIANPTAYPQSTPAIYSYQSVIIDPIHGKVYDINGNPYAGGNGPASDPFGLSLFVSDVGQPAHGSATIMDDGRILYTHTDSTYLSGTDEFTYTISNGFGGMATSGVQVTLQSPDLTVSSVSQLSSAIATANANPAVAWAIHIATAANQTWTTSGFFSGNNTNGYYSAYRITGNMTIDATQSPGFTLHLPPGGFSGPPARAFVVISGGQLGLKDLTIDGGTAYSSPPPAIGGAVLNYGIFSAQNVTFANNSTYVMGLGGALYNEAGTATLTDCAFRYNAATNNGRGGAIATHNGLLTLTRVTFSGNTAATAPDLYVWGDGAAATVNATGSNPVFVLATTNGGTLAVSGLISTGVDILHRSAGQVVTTPVATLLANDLGDSLSFVSADATSANGVAISVAAGVLTYAASPLTSDDSFTYTVQDSHGTTATGTVRVLFNNHPPVANDDAVMLGADGTIAVNVATLLGNDTDADGDTLTVTAVGSTAQGSDVWLDGDTVYYDAGGPLTTDDTFTYTITDSHGATASATVTVHPYVPPPPVLTIAPRTGGGVTLQLQGLPDTTYTISVSTDLATWATFMTVTTDDGGAAVLEDPTYPDEGAGRFYRADNNN